MRKPSTQGPEPCEWGQEVNSDHASQLPGPQAPDPVSSPGQTTRSGATNCEPAVSPQSGSLLHCRWTPNEPEPGAVHRGPRHALERALSQVHCCAECGDVAPQSLPQTAIGGEPGGDGAPDPEVRPPGRWTCPLGWGSPAMKRGNVIPGAGHRDLASWERRGSTAGQWEDGAELLGMDSGPPHHVRECSLLQACLTLRPPRNPLSTGFPRQEYWSGWPCPPPGHLPDPGIKPMSPASPALQADSLPTGPPGKPIAHLRQGYPGGIQGPSSQTSREVWVLKSLTAVA